MTALEQAREALISRLLAHAAIHDAHTPHDDEQRQWADDLRAAAAALSTQEVPAGEWVMVPREPTPTMMNIARGALAKRNLYGVWKAMLAAAPAVPKQAEAQPKGWKCEAVTADFSENTITLEVKASRWEVMAAEYLLIPPAAPQD